MRLLALLLLALTGCAASKRIIAHPPEPHPPSVCRGRETQNQFPCDDDWYPIYKK